MEEGSGAMRVCLLGVAGGILFAFVAASDEANRVLAPMLAVRPRNSTRAHNPHTNRRFGARPAASIEQSAVLH